MKLIPNYNGSVCNTSYYFRFKFLIINLLGALQFVSAVEMYLFLKRILTTFIVGKLLIILMFSEFDNSLFQFNAMISHFGFYVCGLGAAFLFSFSFSVLQ